MRAGASETAHAMSESLDVGSGYLDLGLERSPLTPAEHAHIWRPHHVRVDRPLAQRIAKRTFDIIGALGLALFLLL